MACSFLETKASENGVIAKSVFNLQFLFNFIFSLIIITYLKVGQLSCHPTVAFLFLLQQRPSHMQTHPIISSLQTFEAARELCISSDQAANNKLTLTCKSAPNVIRPAGSWPLWVFRTVFQQIYGDFFTWVIIGMLRKICLPFQIFCFLYGCVTEAPL